MWADVGDIITGSKWKVTGQDDHPPPKKKSKIKRQTRHRKETHTKLT